MEGRGAFRDFQPNPIPLLALEHLSIYVHKHLTVQNNSLAMKTETAKQIKRQKQIKTYKNR